MMSERPRSPPRLASRLLTLLLPAEYREAVLGDLAEEFDARCREGRISRFTHAW